VTTNISPFIDGRSIDVFSTQDVEGVVDPTTATKLYG